MLDGSQSGQRDWRPLPWKCASPYRGIYVPLAGGGSPLIAARLYVTTGKGLNRPAFQLGVHIGNVTDTWLMPYPLTEPLGLPRNEEEYYGSHSLMTGGVSGIGAATAKLLKASGYTVVANCFGNEDGASTRLSPRSRSPLHANSAWPRMSSMSKGGTSRMVTRSALQGLSSPPGSFTRCGAMACREAPQRSASAAVRHRPPSRYDRLKLRQSGDAG